MAIIGRNQAVAELFGNVKLWGLPAFLAWGAIHLAYLVGWGSRVETVARWGWTLLARNRRERLISINSVATGGPILRELGVTQRASIDGVRPPADVLAAP